MKHLYLTVIPFLAITFLSACQSTPERQSRPPVDTSSRTAQAETQQSSASQSTVSTQHAIPEFSNESWRSESIPLDAQLADSPHANTISLTRFYYDDKYVDRINLTSGILFNFDSAQLSRQAHVIVSLLLQHFSEQLKEQHVYIVGHTDSDGSASYNLDLSLRRASSVLRTMRARGIPTERLNLVPAGEHIPLVPNTTSENKAINRRVEIYISPWEDMPLSLLRDWKCPDRVCQTVDLNILSVTRDFTVANNARDTTQTRTIRPMQTEQSTREVQPTVRIRKVAQTMGTREVAEQQTIREVQQVRTVRTLPILSARYRVNSSDPDYQPLIERLQARGF